MPATPPFSNMRFFQSLWDEKDVWAVSMQELYFFNLIPKNPVCRKTEEQALVKLLTYFKNANLYTELKWRDLSIELKMILAKLREEAKLPVYVDNDSSRETNFEYASSFAYNLTDYRVT